MTQPMQEELDFSIVSAQLTIEAMRNSGYKDTDHALAELIDNSVEAEATTIEVVAVEIPGDPAKRYSHSSIAKIAVADNGEGMDATILRRALRFGDGTRLDRKARGIGRFGIGLPQSSVSQCRRVDIWTWRNGPDNAYHCYLDLSEIKDGQQEVPTPVACPVPDYWRTLECTAQPTGTLVVWSELDRVQWSGGRKTLERTATLCGRVYRKFIADRQKAITIQLVRMVEDSSGIPKIIQGDSYSCLPNDPLYLMENTSTPSPFSDRPMFRPFNKRTWTINVGDSQADVHVRCALALPEAILEDKSATPWPKSYANPGNSPWGKHANKNKGVSIVRASRELELSLAWVNNHEPEERWWSVEIEFDPILDEIFGVVNNKQHAHNFVGGAGFDWREVKYEGESRGEFMERLSEQGHPGAHFVEIWEWMDKQIVRMRKEREHIRKGTRSGSRHPQSQKDIEDVATDVVEEQTARGEVGASDQAPQISDDEKRSRLGDSLENHHVDPSTARERASEIVDRGRRVMIQSVPLGHKLAFFDVDSVGDVIEVLLNESHPFHEHLIDVLVDGEEEGAEDLARRLRKADFTLRMLLIAWARYEDKLPRGDRTQAQDARMDWGREARRFLDVIES